MLIYQTKTDLNIMHRFKYIQPTLWPYLSKLKNCICALFQTYYPCCIFTFFMIQILIEHVFIFLFVCLSLSVLVNYFALIDSLSFSRVSIVQCTLYIAYKDRKGNNNLILPDTGLFPVRHLSYIYINMNIFTLCLCLSFFVPKN